MNVNGARYHMLYGRDDWGTCTVMVAGKRRKLSAQWKLAIPPATVPAWNAERGHLSLAHLDADIPATQGERSYLASDRRGATADANGNLYVVNDARDGIDVISRGSGRTSAFWPAPPPRSRSRPGDFGDAAPLPAFDGLIVGLAVTSENYLVAAFGDGLLRFDLVGGGPPERFAFAPSLGTIAPTDLAPGPCGGVWLLDGSAATLYRLDRNLGFVTAPGGAAVPAAFQPLDRPGSRTDSPSKPLAIALPIATPPIALASTDRFEAVVLCENGAGTRLLTAATNATSASPLIDLPHATFCMAISPSLDGEQVMLADVDGNQTHRVVLARTETGLSARLDPVTIPMRRFGGRALLAQGAYVVYDSGTVDPLWVPLLAQKRQSFADANTFLTPCFDSDAPQCVWDRIRLDGCIPPGTSVTIEARASDDLALMGSAAEIGWTLQPHPYLNRDGGELPGKRAIAKPRTDAGTGSGCWDLLLQDVVGRYLELRVTLGGDGRFTPHLRAMRVWYPRFSYPEKFLPAVYREEPGPASFIERFLASMEGINTVVEDRIAAAQVLFDTRTAPGEALDWLAGWYDMALDPRWDEGRKRLFLRHAARFFGWRGTVRGIKAALRLAFEDRPDDGIFALEQPGGGPARGIRVVEGFSTRPALAPIPDTTTATGLPTQALSDARWSPAEGAAGLARRWAIAAEGAVPDALPETFELDPAAHAQGDFASFALAQLGFVPSVGIVERARWIAFQHGSGVATPVQQTPRGSVADSVSEGWNAFCTRPSRERTLWRRYLAETHRQIGKLNLAWNTDWDDFAQVPLPDHVPYTPAAIRDWLVFEGRILPVDRAAHRFSILLPRRSVDQGFEAEQDMLAVARRLVAIEKPAHTEFDVRFYWAMNRLGEARTGLDTQLGQGSRAPELVPPAVIGRAWLGAGFVGGAATEPGRSVLAC